MNKSVFVALLVIVAFVSAYITSTGISDLVFYFKGARLSLWKCYCLGLGVSFLRNNPFIVTKSMTDMESHELFSHFLVSLIFDCLAVYFILPYALGY